MRDRTQRKAPLLRLPLERRAGAQFYFDEMPVCNMSSPRWIKPSQGLWLEWPPIGLCRLQVDPPPQSVFWGSASYTGLASSQAEGWVWWRKDQKRLEMNRTC